MASELRELAKQWDSLLTSYHEAGHTIYGLLYLLKIDSVSIFPNHETKRIDGFTVYNTPPLDTIIDPILFANRLNTEISISYAGQIAERHLLKSISGSDEFKRFLKNPSSEDTISAGRLIGKYNLASPGSKRSSYKLKIVKEVAKIIKKNWDDLVLIAQNLFKKKRLSFEDLKLLLVRRSKNKKFWREQFKKVAIIYNCEPIDEQQFKIMLDI